MLHLRIHSEINMVSACAQLILYCGTIGARIQHIPLLEEMRNYVTNAVFDEIRHIVQFCAGGFFLYVHPLVERSLVLLMGYEAALVHGQQHHIGASVGDVHLVVIFEGVLILLLGYALGIMQLLQLLPRRVAQRPRIGIGARVGIVGLLHHSGEHGALAYGKLAHLLAEIVLGGGLKAVVGGAQVYVVHVRRKYLILIHDILELHGKVSFLYLALVGLLVGKHLILYKLLGYCAAAVGIGIAQGIYNGGKQPLVVHAVMLVEAHVLYGNQGILEHIRYLAYIRPVPIFHAGVSGYELAVLVVYVGSPVALGELCRIYVLGSLDVCLGYTGNETQPRASGDNYGHRHDLEHGKQQLQNKAAAASALGKQLLVHLLFTFAAKQLLNFIYDGLYPARHVPLFPLRRVLGRFLPPVPPRHIYTGGAAFLLRPVKASVLILEIVHLYRLPFIKRPGPWAKRCYLHYIWVYYSIFYCPFSIRHGRHIMN